MTPYFTIEPYTTLDKSFKVIGPEPLLLEVDYDDVNHEEVDRATEKMVAILNANWDNPAWSLGRETAKQALLDFMAAFSEQRWSAGWLSGLETALLGDPVYEWLVSQAGGWWTYRDEWHDGTLDDLRAERAS